MYLGYNKKKKGDCVVSPFKTFHTGKYMIWCIAFLLCLKTSWFSLFSTDFKSQNKGFNSNPLAVNICLCYHIYGVPLISKVVRSVMFNVL